MAFPPRGGRAAHSKNVRCRPHAPGTDQHCNKRNACTQQIRLPERPLRRQGTKAEQTNQEATNTTAHQHNHYSGRDVIMNRPHAHRPTPSWPGVHGPVREQRPAGDTVASRAHRPPWPQTQRNTVTLPLRTRPTNVHKLHYTTLAQTNTQLTDTDTNVLATGAGFGDKTTSSSTTEPTPTQPTMRRPRQPRTNHTAAAATT